MTINSRTELVQALTAKTADQLLGTAESVWLDFKGAPYRLSEPREKFEFCKDIAAFANAQGGLLVIGVGTRREANDVHEIADRLLPIAPGQINVDQYKKTLTEYIRPRLAVEFHLFEHADAQGEGSHFFVIDVLPLAEVDRYALVRRALSENGRVTEGVTVPVRHADEIVYLNGDELYATINLGIRHRFFPSQRANVIAPAAEIGEELDAAIGGLEQSQDWDATPVVYWQSHPNEWPGQIYDLYGAEGLEGAIAQQGWALRRDGGFNFVDIHGNPRIVGGALELATRRRGIMIKPNGLVTAGAAATDDMLLWAMRQKGYPNRINVVALSEMTIEYYRIVDQYLLPRIQGGWTHRLLIRRFLEPSAIELAEGGVTQWPRQVNARQASANDWDRSWPAAGEPDADAYQCLAAMYELFGIPVATNPYVEGQTFSVQRLADDLGVR